MNSFLPLFAFAAAALASGCSTTGARQAARASDSLHEAADGLQATLPALDAALLALSELVSETGPDLAPQFKVYGDAVSRLESRAGAANVPTVAMQRECLDYFETWNQSRAHIDNGATHMRSLDRTLLIGEQFERARVNFAQAYSDFDPWLGDLRDIRAVLAGNLSHGALNSIRELAARVETRGVPIRASLQSLSEDFEDLGLELASSEPTS